MFNISGIINIVFDTQTFSKGFTKREFILDVRNGERAEKVKFECHGDGVKLLDDFEQGDFVEIEFEVTGREWQGKYFNNLVCFGVESGGGVLKEVAGLSEREQEEVDEEVPF